jgi:uroporphyrinogen III methyltransferase/synthase
VADGRYDWVVFASPNAVDPLLARLPDVRSLGVVKIAAVGPGTAAALAGWRLVADLVPDRSVAEGLVEAFPDPPGPGACVLLPRAAQGRDALPDGLAAAGWDVDAVEAYQTVRLPLAPADRAAVAGADAVCFASASSVTGFVEAAGRVAWPPVVVCIGPTTAAAAVAAHLDVTAVAAAPTIDGLVDALVGALGPTPPPADR